MKTGLKFILALSLYLSAATFAHTPLKQVTPASGSIVSTSPESVTLEFAQPVRLTLVSIESADGNTRQLEFSPSGSADTFTTVAPALMPGRNAIQWKALSPDGHVIEGTVILVLNPEQSSQAPSRLGANLATDVA